MTAEAGNRFTKLTRLPRKEEEEQEQLQASPENRTMRKTKTF
jgi:hypothetical protein